jgi:hypothetical protein
MTYRALLRSANSLRFAMCALVLLAGIDCNRRSQPVGSATPGSVAINFYRWYVGALSQHRTPLDQDAVTMEKYVSVALIAELRRKRSEGPSADYFLKAQDWPDDWITNISATEPAVAEGQATTFVTLGETTEARRRLKINLKPEAGAWKITEVAGMP